MRHLGFILLATFLLSSVRVQAEAECPLAVKKLAGSAARTFVALRLEAVVSVKVLKTQIRPPGSEQTDPEPFDFRTFDVKLAARSAKDLGDGELRVTTLSAGGAKRRAVHGVAQIESADTTARSGAPLSEDDLIRFVRAAVEGLAQLNSGDSIAAESFQVKRTSGKPGQKGNFIAMVSNFPILSGIGKIKGVHIKVDPARAQFLRSVSILPINLHLELAAKQG